MPESIYKLQPHRTMHLRGFDRRGAAAAMVNASDTGFTVRGVFRDMADFAVVMLWDADNFFEHPRLKYLPDFDFSGITLQFDMSYDGLQPIDSVKHSWIDWAELDYVTANDVAGKIRLFDPTTESGLAVPLGTREKATAKITITGDGPEMWDRVTLWYQNFAFDYILDKRTSCEAVFYAAGSGAQHSLVVGEQAYVYIEQPGDGSADVAAHLIAMVNGLEGGYSADPFIVASVGSQAHIVKLARRLDDGTSVWIAGTGLGQMVQVWQIGHAWIAEQLVKQINDANYESVTIPLSATRDGATITVQAEVPGEDGNFITMYAQKKTETLKALPEIIKFSGGSTSSSWRVTIDFSALGLSSLRKAWLTFAPPLPNGKGLLDVEEPHDGLLPGVEWLATFYGWTVTDTLGTRALKVAGPGSVRINSRDAWAKYSGSGWSEEAGWFTGGFARRASVSGDKVMIKYHCQHAHDLYVGTSLYKQDRGSMYVTVDGHPQPYLSGFVEEDSALVTRRRIAQDIAPGEHVVELTLASGYFYFDFLEAAVLSDVPDPSVVYPNVTAAVDYDTDHTYKLPPARLVWNLDKLGLHGQVNEYVGVFWWNQRKRIGGGPSYRDVIFSGPFTAGSDKWVKIHFGYDEQTEEHGPPTLGKTIFPADTPKSIANHFVFAINQTFVACWAELIDFDDDSATMRIWQHTPIWTVYLEAETNAAGTVSGATDILPGYEGTWVIDDQAEDPLNVACHDWHADFFQRIATKGWGAVAAFSMELVDPPEDLGAGKVYAARFADDSPVATDTGFASLKSIHCSFTAAMRSFQSKAYLAMADIMATAGLTPWLQFGEFLWWFFPNRGWPVGGATNASPVEISTIVAHGWNTGDRVIVAGVRGNTAANGTWPITVTGPTTFTLDGSSGSGAFVFNAAATVRGGSMGFYDQETKAAALAALGRDLAVFTSQDDDPDSINGGADANWLRGRIKAHVDGIRSYVLATHPTAKFELLYPDDVNNAACYHTLDLPYPQGGRLNRRVNLPVEYQQKTGSGLDRIKMEALSWGATYRNFDRSEQAIKFPTQELAWAKADTAYLMPIFNGGCPWPREYLAALNNGVPLIVLWAFDHMALYSWPLPLPVNAKTATIY